MQSSHRGSSTNSNVQSSHRGVHRDSSDRTVVYTGTAVIASLLNVRTVIASLLNVRTVIASVCTLAVIASVCTLAVIASLLSDCTYCHRLVVVGLPPFGAPCASGHLGRCSPRSTLRFRTPWEEKRRCRTYRTPGRRVKGGAGPTQDTFPVPPWVYPVGVHTLSRLLAGYTPGSVHH